MYGLTRGALEMATLLVQALSASVQASSPSTQVKAVEGQVGDRGWDQDKKILSSTVRVSLGT